PFADDVLAFSPDSKMLAVSTFYSTILVFAARSGRLVRTIASRSDTTARAFAPGGTLASGTATGTVERWDTMTGRQVGSSLVVAASPVTTVAFDRTGQRYVTAGLGEGGVRLWVTAAPAQPGQILNTDQATTS